MYQNTKLKEGNIMLRKTHVSNLFLDILNDDQKFYDLVYDNLAHYQGNANGEFYFNVVNLKIVNKPQRDETLYKVSFSQDLHNYPYVYTARAMYLSDNEPDEGVLDWAMTTLRAAFVQAVIEYDKKIVTNSLTAEDYEFGNALLVDLPIKAVGQLTSVFSRAGIGDWDYLIKNYSMEQLFNAWWDYSESKLTRHLDEFGIRKSNWFREEENIAFIKAALNRLPKDDVANLYKRVYAYRGMDFAHIGTLNSVDHKIEDQALNDEKIWNLIKNKAVSLGIA